MEKLITTFKFVFVMIFTILTFQVQAQFRIGNEILGGSAFGDEFGESVAFSGDGKVIIVGRPNANLSDAGDVKAYSLSGSTWVQLGATITGESTGDKFGKSVAISNDGKTIAVGATNNGGTGTKAGHVRIYTFNGSAWIQLGADIDGEAAGDESGGSVSISSDGRTVAIGSFYNAGTGTGAGHVRVYKYISSTWTLLGADIDAEAASDHAGDAVSISSDGLNVAIGAPYNTGNGVNSGQVRIYAYDGTNWVQKGSDIDGVSQDLSGSSVAISSDGSTVAIGSPLNSDIALYNGKVNVYRWNGSSWNKIGADIKGGAANDFSGSSVSLSSNGNTLAIGSPRHSVQIGRVRVFTFNGSTWTQRGLNIDGSRQFTTFGTSVSLAADGKTGAIGSPYGYNSGTRSGTAYVYNMMAQAIVTNEPSNKTVCAGSNTLFGILAKDVDSFRWQLNTGAGWSNISNSNNDTLYLTAVIAGMNNYSYKVITYGEGGNDTSQIVTLTVNTVAVIDTEPTDVNLCKNGNATFSIVASGTITGYKWQINTGSGWNDLSGETNTTLSITGITPDSNGYLYRCIVTGPCAIDTSRAALLTVWNPLIIATTNDTACQNQAVTLEAISSSGNASLWFQNDTSISAIFTGNSYTISKPLKSDTFYVASVNATTSGTLFTTNGSYTVPGGVMYDAQINENILLEALDILPSITTARNLDYAIYYKEGSSAGFEYDENAWTLVDSLNNYLSKSWWDGYTKVIFNTKLFLSAGKTYAFYISTRNNIGILCNPANIAGTLVTSNSVLSIYSGKAKYQFGFGSASTSFGQPPATGLYYSKVNCTSDVRTPVYLKIHALPSINSITSSRNPTTNGYAPYQCADLTATVTGGTGTLNYTWSPSGTGNPLNVCPTAGTWYKATVTDANGCKDTMSIKQSVIEATSPYSGRVIMCYNYPRRAPMNINIYPSQVPQYLNAGATLGKCGSSPSKRNTLSNYDDIYRIYPNPANNQITLEWFNLFNEEVNIELVDMTGRVVKNIFNGQVLEGEINLITADLTELPVGMYFMRYSSPTDVRINKVQLMR